MCNDRSWNWRQDTPGPAPPLLCFQIAESLRARHLTSLGMSLKLAGP